MGKKQAHLTQKQSSRSKSKSRKQQQHQEHIFRLKRIKNTNIQCYYPDIEADFNPILTWAGIQQSTLPTFNLDKCYWTKAFVVGLRKDYYMSTPLKEKEKFAHKFRRKTYYQHLSSHSSFEHEPLPLPKSYYCYICEKDFGKDYYGHIRQQHHRKNQDKGKGSEFIYQIVGKYNNHQRTPQRQVEGSEKVQRTGDKNSTPPTSSKSVGGPKAQSAGSSSLRVKKTIK